MSEIIDTLSDQDSARLDKIKLWTTLGKIKKMCLKMNKVNKSNRNENSMSDFHSLLFSPVMENLATCSCAGESASLTLDIGESFESKFLRASSE